MQGVLDGDDNELISKRKETKNSAAKVLASVLIAWSFLFIPLNFSWPSTNSNMRFPIQRHTMFCCFTLHWLVTIGTSQWLVFSNLTNLVHGFSASMSIDFSLDRFRPTCPADPSCIRQFDPSLVDSGESGAETVWVAVYRSSNNKPSVFVRDDFFQAMGDATSTDTKSKDNPSSSASPTSVGPPPQGLEAPASLQLEKPVAVARLIPSKDFDSTWVLDNMRCSLRKEDTDDACDGGSEYVEAISVGVDSLLLHHLQQNLGRQQSKGGSDDAENNLPVFEGVIRTKATLFSGKLLENRGFQPVEELAKDMATHVSAYDACVENYAKRTVSTVSKNPGTRDRALLMVSLLGKLDREDEIAAAATVRQRQLGKEASDDEEDAYDPWAGANKFQL